MPRSTLTAIPGPSRSTLGRAAIIRLQIGSLLYLPYLPTLPTDRAEQLEAPAFARSEQRSNSPGRRTSSAARASLPSWEGGKPFSNAGLARAGEAKTSNTGLHNYGALVKHRPAELSVWESGLQHALVAFRVAAGVADRFVLFPLQSGFCVDAVSSIFAAAKPTRLSRSWPPSLRIQGLSDFHGFWLGSAGRVRPHSLTSRRASTQDCFCQRFRRYTRIAR